MPVDLTSPGDEAALGFSVTFDPSVLKFMGADLGDGAAGALLNLNTNYAPVGGVGMTLALPSGTTAAGSARRVVVLHFLVSSLATGSTTVSFGSAPVAKAVASGAAQSLTTTYVDGTLTVGSQTVVNSPTLDIFTSGASVTISWPAAATGFVLESVTNSYFGNWSPVAQTPVTNGSAVSITVTPSNAAQFFRLNHP